MPPKVKQLMKQLEKAGFVNRGGKGSHRNYEHENGQKITISGKAGSDAKIYQIKGVNEAVEESMK